MAIVLTDFSTQPLCKFYHESIQSVRESLVLADRDEEFPVSCAETIRRDTDDEVRFVIRLIGSVGLAVDDVEM